MKLTDWYDGSQKPARVGVYERTYDYGIEFRYCYWDGIYWSCGCDVQENAVLFRDRRSIEQSLPWRGIAK